MSSVRKVVAVIPALDEAATIGDVVGALRAFVDAVVVADNGSRDATAAVAREAGAEVVVEAERGYGAACLAGIDAAGRLGADTLLFLDADGSDDPGEAPAVIAPIADGSADLVLGIRTPSSTEPGAMTGAQRFGNWLAPFMMRHLLGAPYIDMPPFKAIRWDALQRLRLSDRRFGFTIQLLVRAHAERLRVREVVVRCRARRGGTSKVSGTLAGSARAGVKILWTILRHAPERTRA